ncbi:cell shape determination protein CcmA [Candidatus Marinamargulisbacteria bacterium SCGC AG-343-D04]|nr:cell shape determination protein CcmA [Candidatus Marinamargulisbacteria bacterium SCGC AG-343-D04]
MKNQKKYRTDIVNTVVGEDTSVKGMIHSQRSIRIEGTFEGEINSQGEVYIGQNSKVKASLFGKHITVAGEVIGNIEAVKSLHILKTGKVFGDIAGDQLNIEEGGIYKGKVNMDIISSKNAYEGEFQLKTS